MCNFCCSYVLHNVYTLVCVFAECVYLDVHATAEGVYFGLRAAVCVYVGVHVAECA